MALNLGELNAIIDADDRGFNRTIDRVHRKMEAVSKKAGGLTGVLGVLGRATAFTAIATGAAGAASAIGPVVSLVGTLVTTGAGLAAVLPAGLLAAAAAAGTLKLGLTGVGDAIAGDEEALERLPGPAREFVAVVRGLKSDWDDLTKSVQSKLFKGTAGDIRDAADVLLPRLKTGLGQVAEGWNDMFRAALQSAKTPRFIAGISDVLESTGRALSGASTGLDGWARGLGILFSAVAPLLERIGDAAGRIGDRFGAWMEQARVSGDLQRTLDTMLSTLGLLFGIVGNIGAIFGSVFSAANAQGGGLLNVIDDLTGRLSEFFKSADGQEALGSFFSSLASVADQVIPIVLELAKAVGDDLAPHFATIAEQVGPSLRDVIQAIGDIIGGIDVESLADGFADILDAILPLAKPLGDVLSFLSGLNGIVPVVIGVMAAWTIAQWALNAAMWANPITWIIAAIIALIAIIVLLVANWDWVKGQIILGWNVLKDAGIAIWTGIKDFFVTIGTAIADFFVGLWNGIRDFFVGIWNFMVEWVAGKILEFMTAIAEIKKLKTRFTEWIGSARDAAVDKFQSMVDWVAGLPGRILNALGDLGSLLYNAGRDILQGLLDGIQSMWSSVQNKLSDLTSSLPDWKGPEDTDKKLLTPAGRFIIGGLIEGMDAMIPQVQRTLSGLTTDIGLQVDAAAAPAVMAAPVINVAAPVGPNEYVVAVPINLGEGITEVVEIKMERRDRDLVRSIGAGSGSAR